MSSVCFVFSFLGVNLLVTNSDTHSDTNTQTQNTFSLYSPSATLSFSLFLSPSIACANARPHQRIGLDYNLICCGRDGIEHQIIPNEENQSPRVQISRKLVNSDWFRHSSRQGGIWQITASQVDREKGREEKWLNRKKPAMEQKSEVIIIGGARRNSESSSQGKKKHLKWESRSI